MKAAQTRTDSSPVYDTASLPPPFWEELVQVWRYRDLLVQLVSRDLKTRYKRSVLGVAWTLLNPLGMLVVLTVVFSNLFRFDLPNYPVYLLAGIVFWTFFAQTSIAVTSHLLWGGTLLSRIYVPRTVFALSAAGTGLINFAVSLVPLFAITVVEGIRPDVSLIWVPFAMLLAAAFALGVGLLLSTLALEFPDIVDMYQIAISAWYFLTPILYPQQIFPEAYRWALDLNPAYHILEVFRHPVYWGSAAGPLTIIAATVSAVATLAVGWIVFTMRADRISYRI
ncbi:MAG: ABC transporter permease [Chloroflexota bacterium]|nr:ABC transporter permease [Chloroflexota bacterium]